MRLAEGQYGVSWQVVPRVRHDLVNDPNSEKSHRAMTDMLKMKKLSIAELKRAYDEQNIPDRS